MPALKILVETGKNLERRPRKDDEAQPVKKQVVQPNPQGKDLVYSKNPKPT